MTTTAGLAALIDTANALARELAAGHFDDALQTMSPDIKKSLTRDHLAGLWHQFVQQFGLFQKFEPARVETRSGLDVVILPARFQRQIIDLLISVRDGLVVGFFVQPHTVGLAEWQPPDYVDRTTFC